MKTVELTVSVRNNRMKQLRKEKCLSQKRLATLSGVSIAIVTSLECLSRIRFSPNKKVRKRQEERLFDNKRKIAEVCWVCLVFVCPDDLDLVITNRVVKHIDVPTALALERNKNVLLLHQSEEEAFDMKKIFIQDGIKNQLETLSPREQQIIELRFGLNSGEPQTLEEVGRKFRATRERIRQIEAAAIRKLRHPSRARPLREFL